MCSHPSSGAPEEDAPPINQLHRLVKRLQSCVRALHGEQDATRIAELKISIQAISAEIAIDLYPDLLIITQEFIRKSLGKELSQTRDDAYHEVKKSLALSFFFHILDALPLLKLDEQTNLRIYLLAIVRRKQTSDETRINALRPYCGGARNVLECSNCASMLPTCAQDNS